MSGDIDVDAFWLSFTLSAFNVTVVSGFFVNGSPLASVHDFGVWDIKVVFFGGKFVGFPAAFLFVVLDKELETVCEVKFNGKVCTLEFYKVSCIIAYCGVCCFFEVPIGNITVTSSIEFYTLLEYFFCSGRHHKVQFNVIRQQIVA